HVSQFTDISRPVVFFKKFQGLRRKFLLIDPLLFSDLIVKEIYQNWNIIPSFIQWRNLDKDHRQPVKKIFPEFFLFYFFFKVFIGRSNYPNIYFNILIATYP